MAKGTTVEKTNEASTIATDVKKVSSAPLFDDFELVEFEVKARGGKGRNWGEIKPTITYLEAVESWQLNKKAKETIKKGTYRLGFSAKTNMVALIWHGESAQYRLLGGETIHKALGLGAKQNMKIELSFDNLPDYEGLVAMGPIEVTIVKPREKKVKDDTTSKVEVEDAELDDDIESEEED